MAVVGENQMAIDNCKAGLSSAAIDGHRKMSSIVSSG